MSNNLHIALYVSTEASKSLGRFIDHSGLNGQNGWPIPDLWGRTRIQVIHRNLKQKLRQHSDMVTWKMKGGYWFITLYAIGSVGLVYTPTWMVDFYGFHVGKYTIHGLFGYSLHIYFLVKYWQYGVLSDNYTYSALLTIYVRFIISTRSAPASYKWG